MERTGAIMGFQIPLLVIDRIGVSVMSGLFPNRRVAHLRVDDRRDRNRSRIYPMEIGGL